MAPFGTVRAVVPLVGTMLAFGAVPSASAASCAPLVGEQVVAKSTTAVVVKGGLEPERESSGDYGNGSYYACVLRVGRRIRIGSYHGGPLVEEWLAAFQFAGHYLTFIQYEAGTGTAVQQYDLTTGRRTFNDISFRGTVRASLNDGPPLTANVDGGAAWITEQDYYSKTYAFGTKPLWRERVVVHVGSKTETFATYGPVQNNPVPVLSHPFVISGLRITQHTVAWVYNGRTIRHRLRQPRAHRR
jgi:hypothetical protein